MYAIDGPGCSWYVDSYHITCYRSVLLSLRPCGLFDVGHPGVRFSHLVHSDLALDLASNGIFALHGFVQHMEIWKLLHMDVMAITNWALLFIELGCTAYWRQSLAFFLPLSLSFLNLTTVKLISHFWFAVCLGGLHSILQVGSEVWNSILVCPLLIFRWTNPTAEMSNSVLGSVWICCAFTILLSKFHCDTYQNDTGVTQLVDLVVVRFLQLLATVATPQGIRQHLATKKLLREVWLRGHRCVGQNEQLVRVTSWPGSHPGSCQYRHPISSLLVLWTCLFYAVPSHSQGPWQLIWSKSLVLGISCFHAWPAILRTSHWVTSDAPLETSTKMHRSHLMQEDDDDLWIFMISIL